MEIVNFNLKSRNVQNNFVLVHIVMHCNCCTICSFYRAHFSNVVATVVVLEGLSHRVYLIHTHSKHSQESLAHSVKRNNF
jgi:hypothetical protein